ncbi:hypothetical protein LY78DRAFT_234391 [Colletotrichum sublineola]|nr:hypothetical protein LY78DRAFT_234391 [Colletotrichum sublineola]
MGVERNEDTSMRKKRGEARLALADASWYQNLKHGGNMVSVIKVANVRAIATWRVANVVSVIKAAQRIRCLLFYFVGVFFNSFFIFFLTQPFPPCDY